MKFKFSFLILYTISSFSIVAQTCCSGGIPLSNNLGLNISKKGTIQIGLAYDYNNLNTLNSGTENLEDNSRLRVTHSFLINTGYSISNNISVETLFTWINQRRKISQFGNENFDQTSGIGDAVLLLKYNFSNLLGKNSNLNIGLGAKIPFGSSTETNAIGITLNSDLQPGSNTWDTIYYTFISKNLNIRPSFGFFSKIIYRNTGTNNTYLNTLKYKFGNEFQAFLGFSDQFLLFKTLSNSSLSFKYRIAEKDRLDGFELENTGGKWLFLLPNFSLNITKSLSINTKVEIPIYSNVDGTQLTPSFRISSGILLKIDRKQKLLL
ncbi:hypothetical protein [Olleya sp. R77988]|uniref:hypothetical protein n=1 Tax=Olleya sp. R77988 TaxID=3093875 RepID=UPI0037CC5CCB